VPPATSAPEPRREGPGLARLPPHPPLQRYYESDEQRRGRVDRWFDQAAGDYDWINRAMSFGSGGRYRRQALVRAGLATGMSLLDVGTGTGGVAAEGRRVVGPAGRVVALDPSLGMLLAGVRHPVSRLRGMAEALPVATARFDMLSMGYALRHVADLRATFEEYRRVLRTGGRLLLLEITAPPPGWSRRLLGLYLGGVVPLVARFGRGGRASRELMEYYWDTIAHCVPPETILDALAEAGFTQPRRRIELGVFSEYTATC
jgi:demethylmenaquinone methyltransferase / 2-methoxy-6-polyprenyl-1,4-benzoquinol methylase